MTERVRTGIALGQTARARLAALVESTGLSQNAVIEALILGVTESQVSEITARGAATIKHEKKIRLAQNRALREQMATLTPEQRESLLAHAAKLGSDAQ